jgi:hypothetical protein
MPKQNEDMEKHLQQEHRLGVHESLKSVHRCLAEVFAEVIEAGTLEQKTYFINMFMFL